VTEPGAVEKTVVTCVEYTVVEEPGSVVTEPGAVETTVVTCVE